MRIAFWMAWIVAGAMVSCQKTDCRMALEHISQLEERATANRRAWLDGQAAHDASLLKELGQSYGQFVRDFPEAPECPEMLFRAGELYAGELASPGQAIAYFRQNVEDFPEHRTAPNALFYIGYIQLNQLRDTSSATLSYQQFLRKYPQHDMAAQVRGEIASLDIPLEKRYEEWKEATDSLPRLVVD